MVYFFVGKSKVVVVVVGGVVGLAVGELLVDWLLLLLVELLYVVGCRRKLIVAFGDVVLFHLGGACCNFCFVLLLLLEM